MLVSLFTLVALTTLGLSQSENVYPVASYYGSVSESTRINPIAFNLDSAGEVLILDHGSEVAGTPYFVVDVFNGPAQIEVKYSEELSGLENPNSDGPYSFSPSLSNTFRVETFNVTSLGFFESFFIQGGQRWQSIRQLTGGQIAFSEVGLVPSAAAVGDTDMLPGHFECSNEDYNRIWQLGARAASAACVEAGTQNATWEITDEGARIRGQKTAVSALGVDYLDYTLSFITKIERGGTGWSVAQGPISPGLQFLLVSELPEQSTFVNTNTTLLQANAVNLAYGYGFVNQTTLPTRNLGNFSLFNPVPEGIWYYIETTVSNGTQLLVRINGLIAMNISLSARGVALSNPFNPVAPAGAGSWGFGPWQDQVAVVRDVVVTAKNGSVLYMNNMTSPDVLSEYGVAQNNATVCLDGAKRDRLVWLGDFFHTSRIIPASTARKTHVLGTLQYFLDWQNEEGLLPISPPMGYDPIYAPEVGAYLGLQDYQILGLLAFTGYYDQTGDIDFINQLWPGFRKQVSWMISQINASTGLAEIGGFIGPASGTATSAALVQALNAAAVVAQAANDAEYAAYCSANASIIANAIESLLWNEELGVYATSLSAPSNFSVADTSFAITSGIAARNTTRLTSLLNALEQLRLGPGYKDSTSQSSDSPATNISPNINGFLLSALMQSNATAQGKFLIDNLWTAMISNDSTTTGASWEYVNAHDLSPGLGLFTSLSHPWGGAPTYVLPQWIAGVRSVKPGYQEWLVVPGFDGFNLTSAKARVPTQYGSLNVEWTLGSGSELDIFVSAPGGTSGSLSLPSGRVLGSWTVNGEQGQGGSSIPLGSGASNVTIQFT